VADALRLLPDDYHLVSDVVVAPRARVDHVLVGPCGVVVIEPRHVSGLVHCDGDRWSVNGQRRPSFSRRVNARALLVSRWLGDRHPELDARGAGAFTSIVVFTNPRCRLEIHRPQTTVVRFSELLDVVLQLGQRRHLPPELAARLARTLTEDTGHPAPRAELPA
jgi:hypothetical protein